MTFMYTAENLHSADTSLEEDAAVAPVSEISVTVKKNTNIG